MEHSVKNDVYWETFEGGEYVYYLDCGEGITGVGICPNSSNCIHYIDAASCKSIIPQ